LCIARMRLKSVKTPANATGCAIAKVFLVSCFVLFGVRVYVCVSLSDFVLVSPFGAEAKLSQRKKTTQNSHPSGADAMH